MYLVMFSLTYTSLFILLTINRLTNVMNVLWIAMFVVGLCTINQDMLRNDLSRLKDMVNNKDVQRLMVQAGQFVSALLARRAE